MSKWSSLSAHGPNFMWRHWCQARAFRILPLSTTARLNIHHHVIAYPSFFVNVWTSTIMVDYFALLRTASTMAKTLWLDVLPYAEILLRPLDGWRQPKKRHRPSALVIASPVSAHVDPTRPGRRESTLRLEPSLIWSCPTGDHTS
jgi:hypothetical protein